MYSIIAFNKGETSSSTEVRAELGRYGRGSACKGCRTSRVRCSGKLNGTDCERCKRLAKPCLYSSSQSQHHHRNSQPIDSNDKTAQSTETPSPDQPNSDDHWSGVPDSSLPDSTTSDEAQFMVNDPLELDFEMWLQRQNAPSAIEPLRSQIDLVAPSPRTELADHLNYPSLQPEPSREDLDGCELSTHVVPGVGDNEPGKGSTVDHGLMRFPGSESWTSDTLGPISQCKCLQAMTSSLSILRGWTWGGGSGVDPRSRTAEGPAFNFVKAEGFLALFEKSMTQLQIAENCPLACVLSHDLGILLLLVVEQLAKLLLIGGSSASPLNISPVHHPTEIPTAGNSAQQGLDIRPARIGTFEINNPLDIEMIMKLLLQMRARTLDAYVLRWCDKIKHYGLKSLETDLEAIREDLSKVVFLQDAENLLFW